LLAAALRSHAGACVRQIRWRSFRCAAFMLQQDCCCECGRCLQPCAACSGTHPSACLLQHRGCWQGGGGRCLPAAACGLVLAGRHLGALRKLGLDGAHERGLGVRLDHGHCRGNSDRQVTVGRTARGRLTTQQQSGGPGHPCNVTRPSVCRLLPRRVQLQQGLAAGRCRCGARAAEAC
jgi:hypothetical protein